ncbi:nucleotide exchange factor GrpE [Maledivibacter halophilus]|uniref:Protein GrpE n=1 Tax=Maledivibacter halophilus TaxID=36842 RepID=A0A1T5LUG3_9FIRM|nr:nucleotide exchange factor GrpE [Maledivibacter halophilus]SKC79667.1 molecular chaperone GrpE [Maledivibacter halophilus]
MENTIKEKGMETKEEKDEKKMNQDINSNLDATKEEMENQEEIQGNQCENKDFEAVKAELEDYKNRYMRLSADFQNFKRRFEKEKNDIYKFGCEKIVLDLLPVIDNFERAIESGEENNESDGMLDGIKMILKQLMDVLNKHGVEEIEALEKEFDPNFHHAVMQEECEGIDDNIVTKVLQKGYMLNSKVVRPSMVIVSK